MTGRVRTIVLGASSGIGAELARQLAARGHRLALVARRSEPLHALVQELRGAHGEEAAASWTLDASEPTGIGEAFDAMVEHLGGLDCFVYCAGIMPPELNGAFEPLREAEVMRINAQAGVMWLSRAAQHLEAQRRGTLVGVGSIAGDRGRHAFPAYGASKAALHTYLEGLRNRLSNVGVVTIKPGPIETPMSTAVGAQGAAPLVPSVRRMVRGIERGRGTVYVPSKWWLVAMVIRHIPSFLFRRMKL